MEPKYSSTFLFPVRALSNVFRAKFLSGLIAAHSKDLLKLPDELAQYSRPSVFKQWLFHTVPKNWVVYSKPPFSGPAEVVKYIGRYTHSTAISNNRIISMKDDTVEFWFKNTRKKSRWETATLPVMGFIDRFLFHVLPKHFHRIRYYGFLANGKAGPQIQYIRQALADRIEPVLELEAAENPDSTQQCPACSKGTMITFLVLDGHGNVVKETNLDTDSEQMMQEAESP